ncbi:unnamed protein product [Peronospora destructor]|uniref:Mitochondrial import inner membrane translocase subunit TIM22 n=1 Tax=Peronospora destructor TaxID=86335 RepID=A0AAV0TUH2_9STRA|nr:unnamed protein product [Peronospora destructor]
MGFVSKLLPLLTIASVSSVADRRDILSVPPETSKTSSSDCMSTTALLIFRGLGAGLAWTISVDGYALASMTDDQWKQRIATRPGPSIAREAARSLARLSMRNMLGFASFLGIFGGVSCTMEKARGKKDLLNPFVGGFTAGMAILPGELRNPRTLVTAAFLCGSASMALHHFIPKETAKTMVSQ